MAEMIIDGTAVEFTDEKNLLEVVRKVGIELTTPSLASMVPAGCAWWKSREGEW